MKTLDKIHGSVYNKRRQMGKIIKCNRIKIKGDLPRNEIVRKVVNTFIKTEYQKKGKGVTFRSYERVMQAPVISQLLLSSSSG